MNRPPKLSKSARENIRRRYHCEPERYANLLSDQANSCAICGDSATRRSKLIADPRERPQKVSQLVCHCCAHTIRALQRDLEGVTKRLCVQVPLDFQLDSGGVPYATRKYRDPEFGQKTPKSIAQHPNLLEIERNMYRIVHLQNPSTEVNCPPQPTENITEND